MKRCMIVDDSSVIRKVAKRILSGSHYSVVEAGNGGEALEMCAIDMPDMVMIDATLPDMASEDLIRRIVALDPELRPQILICMPELDVATIMRAKRAGASGYVLKPFNRPQLLDGMRQFATTAYAA